MMTQPNPAPKDYDLLAPVDTPPGVTAGDWTGDEKGRLIRVLSDGRIQRGNGDIITECKHCRVPVDTGDICAFCADYTPAADLTVPQRLDDAVNRIDLVRGDINNVLRRLPEDAPMFAIVDITNALGNLRNASVLIDRATDTIEADTLPAENSASSDLQLRGIHRGIRTLLAQVPAHTWTVEEAQAVWEALAGVLHRRQITEKIRRTR